jgi:hypothetical protein
MTDTSEHLTEYHPIEFPPRSWHRGPADSEIESRGIAFFRVGHDFVTQIVRNTQSGDVHIVREALPTMVHTRLGWGLVQSE